MGYRPVRLTSDHRSVTALFNTPLEEDVDYAPYGTALRTDFQIGPFIYAISFSGDENHRSTVNVEFELIDIEASDEDLIKIMSKFKKSLSKDEGTEATQQAMSLQQAKYLERQILNFHPHDELEITGPYAIKIFSTVLNIIKDYIRKHRTRCIVFSAASEDRARLYQKMMKSAFPGAGIRAGPSPWGAGTEIKVCFA